MSIAQPRMGAGLERPMKKPDIPSCESDRLGALRALSVLDTEPEERFDRVTRLASRLFDVPIALVSLVDESRQWFKSRCGLDATETSREISFCGHSILDDEIFVVQDAADDPRFHDNPLVVGEPRIRFYAGCPLHPSGSQRVGTLCLIDQRPRDLTASDLENLRDLAGVVERELTALDLATVDSLTGLANRAALQLMGEQAVAISRRTGRPNCLALLDMDGFKRINDDLGHAAGDEALIEMSAILKQVFRESDIVGRIGGDEFCVLLGETYPQDPAAPLERLAAAVREHNVSRPSTHPLAYSVGWSAFDPARHGHFADWMREVDAAMYEAKPQRR